MYKKRDYASRLSDKVKLIFPIVHCQNVPADKIIAFYIYIISNVHLSYKISIEKVAAGKKEVMKYKQKWWKHGHLYSSFRCSCSLFDILNPWGQPYRFDLFILCISYCFYKALMGTLNWISMSNYILIIGNEVVSLTLVSKII